MALISISEGRAYRAPAPLDAEYRLDGFECGKAPLDDWLKAHAVDNDGKASRTYVIANDAMVVQAYYTLAVGAAQLKDVPRKYRHGLPNPVPVMVLGRLAVDKNHHGNGLGPAMLKEAMERTVKVAGQAGVRALIVHAIDDEAISFYTRFGFQIFPAGTRTLFLPIETIARAVAG